MDDLKFAVQKLARSFGYEVRRIAAVTRVETASNVQEELQELRTRLVHSDMMRKIHQRDGQEIEALLRMTALPDLPPKVGREERLADLIGTNVCEGLYLLDALYKGMSVEGDICEFGVAQGATSQLIASEIMSTDRKFWLFDSFEGLPAPTKEDKLIDDIFSLGSMDRYKGTMMSPETEVRGRLDQVKFPHERLRVMKGWVSDSIKRPDVPKRVAFAYVDFDFYEPIRDALVFLDARMLPGARIVVDDYGFFSEGAQLATDEFVAAAGGRWKLSKPLPLAGHFVTLEKLR
jgi:O-methyltransferase